MRLFKCSNIIAVVTTAVFLVAVSAARADWFPGDTYKMHYPQLPDPTGWDVNFTAPKVLADDWMCTETGPVNDIHFWFSFRQGQPVPISSIHLSIHSDVPVSPTNPFSHPGSLLWSRDFLPSDVAILYPWGSGPQGWYDPNTGLAIRPDHSLFGQVNVRIPDTANPFIQQVSNIYWLDISVVLASGQTGQIGWKSSKDHFNDDAVWGDYNAAGGVDQWHELRDPFTGESMDLAFVITTVPEPTGAAILGVGAALLLGWVRGRRQIRR